MATATSVKLRCCLAVRITAAPSALDTPAEETTGFAKKAPIGGAEPRGGYALHFVDEDIYPDDSAKRSRALT